MKKIVLGMACAAMLAATANADFLRAEMGAGAWMGTPSGGVVATGSTFTGSDVAKEDSATNVYAWIMLKHFIPVVPNLRLEYVDVTSDGVATGTFKEFTAADSATTLDMKQIDVIPYYNLLDNTAWVTLDLGLDIKVLDVTYDVKNVAGYTAANYNESQNVALPLGYVRGRVQVPGTGLGVEADVKYVSYSDTTVYDVRAKVDYTFDITPLIQPAIEVGYRMQKYEVEELSDVAMNLDFSGVYAGIMLRF
jgi:outer membrane protein